MKEFLEKLFSSDFMPHGYCYSWNVGLVWLHLVSDALIAIAYFSIPVTLVYFIRKRRDLPFHWIFISFGMFILACGATHTMEIWTLWHATYWLSGAIKAVTAMVSVATAILLVPIVPKALLLPSPEAMRLEIAERKRTEQALLEAKNELELRVLERTEELRNTNEHLVAEIAQRKLAEKERERLRQLEANLAHVNRVSMLGELGISLAHELNQPITAAITSANACLRWLRRDPPDMEEACEAISSIVQGGNRAAEIINRLRSLYKNSPPQRELVDLNEIVREMIVLLRNEASQYSIYMQTELAPEPAKVRADRVQLQQVFMNLMLNAIEAMKETGGVLTIKSQLREGGQVLISVSDTGVGLPAEKADQIYDFFFTTKPHGSGMGLAISRSIIESHGGRLWATTNDGRGATFHFTLPTATEEL